MEKESYKPYAPSTPLNAPDQSSEPTGLGAINPEPLADSLLESFAIRRDNALTKEYDTAIFNLDTFYNDSKVKNEYDPTAYKEETSAFTEKIISNLPENDPRTGRLMNSVNRVMIEGISHITNNVEAKEDRELPPQVAFRVRTLIGNILDSAGPFSAGTPQEQSSAAKTIFEGFTRIRDDNDVTSSGSPVRSKEQREFEFNNIYKLSLAQSLREKISTLSEEDITKGFLESLSDGSYETPFISRSLLMDDTGSPEQEVIRIKDVLLTEDQNDLVAHAKARLSIVAEKKALFDSSSKKSKEQQITAAVRKAVNTDHPLEDNLIPLSAMVFPDADSGFAFLTQAAYEKYSNDPSDSTIDSNPNIIRVRGAQHDSPEYGEWAVKGKDFLEELTEGEEMFMTTEGHQDSFNRLLVKFFVHENRNSDPSSPPDMVYTNVGESIVANGLGFQLTINGETDPILQAIQNEARDNRVGMWSTGNIGPDYPAHQRRLLSKAKGTSDYNDLIKLKGSFLIVDSPEVITNSKEYTSPLNDVPVYNKTDFNLGSDTANELAANTANFDAAVDITIATLTSQSRFLIPSQSAELVDMMIYDLEQNGIPVSEGLIEKFRASREKGMSHTLNNIKRDPLAAAGKLSPIFQQQLDLFNEAMPDNSAPQDVKDDYNKLRGAFMNRAKGILKPYIVGQDQQDAFIPSFSRNDGEQLSILYTNEGITDDFRQAVISLIYKSGGEHNTRDVMKEIETLLKIPNFGLQNPNYIFSTEDQKLNTLHGQGKTHSGRKSVSIKSKIDSEIGFMSGEASEFYFQGLAALGDIASLETQVSDLAVHLHRVNGGISEKAAVEQAYTAIVYGDGILIDSTVGRMTSFGTAVSKSMPLYTGFYAETPKSKSNIRRNTPTKMIMPSSLVRKLKEKDENGDSKEHILDWYAKPLGKGGFQDIGSAVAYDINIARRLSPATPKVGLPLSMQETISSFRQNATPKIHFNEDIGKPEIIIVNINDGKPYKVRVGSGSGEHDTALAFGVEEYHAIYSNSRTRSYNTGIFDSYTNADGVTVDPLEGRKGVVNLNALKEGFSNSDRYGYDSFGALRIMAVSPDDRKRQEVNQLYTTEVSRLPEIFMTSDHPLSLEAQKKANEISDATTNNLSKQTGIPDKVIKESQTMLNKLKVIGGILEKIGTGIREDHTSISGVMMPTEEQIDDGWSFEDPEKKTLNEENESARTPNGSGSPLVDVALESMTGAINKDKSGINVQTNSIGADGKPKASGSMTIPKRESALENSIIKEEGVVVDTEGNHVAYIDSEGHLTVGHGHKVLPGDNIVKGQAISPDRAEKLFTKDMASVKKQTRGLTKNFDILPLEAQEVLMQMVFQMGFAGVRKFKEMVKALNLNKPDLKKAADEMLNSTWAKEQTPARAKRLAKIMRNA